MEEDRFQYLEKEISKTPLYGFLGAEGIEELRHQVINIICERVKEDLADSHYYIMNPDDVNETLGENIIQEAIDEIKVEWKEKIKEYMSKKLEDMLK